MSSLIPGSSTIPEYNCNSVLDRGDPSFDILRNPTKFKDIELEGNNLVLERGKLFVIAPAFNEEAGIRHFLRVLSTELNPSAIHRELHVVVIDDGSHDHTLEFALDESSKLGLAMELVKLSRNYGQQSAFHAGLSHASSIASADAVFLLMDSDLQHPPGLAVSMLAELDSGFDHVQMIREPDMDLPWIKRASSSGFYRLLRAASGVPAEPGASDFRLISYRFLRAYLQYTEVNRFNRAIFLSLGFPTKRLRYKPERRHSGETKYSLSKMLLLGFQGCIQFTNAPLIITSLGTFLLSVIVCLGYGFLELVAILRGVQFVVGWPTIIFFVFFWGGLLSLNQLMSSLYLASVYNEVKNRPVFIIESVYSTLKDHRGKDN